MGRKSALRREIAWILRRFQRLSKYMVRHRTPPSHTWRSFLDNHANDVLRHDRRRIVHFNVTEHPSAEWTAQQMVNAFPWDTAPRYLVRDRDQTYGAYFDDPPSSNLTNDPRRDVRKDIARIAGVSTGNVTKTKQLLDSVIPEVREWLLRGEVSIHRVCLLFIHPRAPNLIGLRSAGTMPA